MTGYYGLTAGPFWTLTCCCGPGHNPIPWCVTHRPEGGRTFCTHASRRTNMVCEHIKHACVATDTFWCCAQTAMTALLRTHAAPAAHQSEAHLCGFCLEPCADGKACDLLQMHWKLARLIGQFRQVPAARFWSAGSNQLAKIPGTRANCWRLQTCAFK